MIYEKLKPRLLAILKAPTQPPEPPPGTGETLQVFRAAPNFLKYQLVVWGLGFTVGITAELIFLGVEIVRAGTDEEARWAGMALGVALLTLTVIGAVIKYILIRIDYDMRYYVVTDRSLRIREGALLIHEATFTYANVQNLKIHQGPLERLLGISNLVLETAGGAGGSGDERGQNPFRRGHEGRLRGIANARDVRDTVQRLLKRYRDAGLGDPEDRRRAVPAAAGGGFSPREIERLREIRDELRLLRGAAGGGARV